MGLDNLRPLPEIFLGNKHILAVSNYFTKCVEACPMPNQEAVTITNVLELCSLLDTDKTRKTACHPQSDGLVEVLLDLRKYVE